MLRLTWLDEIDADAVSGGPGQPHGADVLWAGVAAAVLVSLAFGALLTFGPSTLTFEAQAFIGGTLLLPTTFDMIWFSIFGRAATEIETANPGVLTGPVVEQGDTSDLLADPRHEYTRGLLGAVLVLAVPN